MSSSKDLVTQHCVIIFAERLDDADSNLLIYLPACTLHFPPEAPTLTTLQLMFVRNVLSLYMVEGQTVIAMMLNDDVAESLAAEPLTWEEIHNDKRFVGLSSMGDSTYAAF